MINSSPFILASTESLSGDSFLFPLPGSSFRPESKLRVAKCPLSDMTRVSQGVSGREGNVNLVSPAVQCTLPFTLLESSLIRIYSVKKPPGKIFPLIILIWRVKIREEVGLFNYYFYLCNMPGSYNGNKVVAKH